jgi:lipoprotein-anchoring transpeptidase ErfK/SrfK
MLRLIVLLTAAALTPLVHAQGGGGPAAADSRPVLRVAPLDPASPAPTGGSLIPAARPLPAADQAPSPLDVKPTGDDAIRLQIFLDEQFFGPGIIDGKPGRFTQEAVRSWNEANGHPTNDWTAVNTAARRAVQNAFAIAVVPEIASEWVDPTLPTSREGQAKRKRMSYRSYAEFMAERYHCDRPFLIELNGSSRINNLKPRDSIVVPNVKPFQIELVTGTEYEREEPFSSRYVVVDTKMNQMRIFEGSPPALIVAEPGQEPPAPRPNRALVASFPITPGQPQFIEFGTWELRNMVERPWWRYDQQFLDTGKRSDNALNIPPGPNSPVGMIWCGTSRSGIGLHGTSDPETIGRARSAGCIRLANWDATRLPLLIRPGASIEIR